MCPLARVAVGTIQSGTDRRCLLGALHGVLAREGLDVQPFVSRACFGCQNASVLARQAPRHLDSWLMTREVCLELFLHGARSADLALIEGDFRPRSSLESLCTPCEAVCARDCREGGSASLETLCEWLDLPAVAVVDVAQISGCRIPQPPCRLHGVLLDRVPNRRAGHRWRTVFESLWDAPVLGFLDDAASLRAMIEAGDPDLRCEGVLGALADRLAETLDLPALLRLAEHRPLFAFSGDLAAPLGPWPGAGRGLGSPVRIAVAYDEAFHCYFPDTLDLLEARGAAICVFSPLRDESLPEDVDLVYLGCGCPERFADPLAENHCLKQALRTYAESGGRVYAEGGGLAYLCQQIVLPTGRRLPMVGALPAVAARALQPHPPQPAEATLRVDNWLAERGSRVRGYLNSAWRILPIGPLVNLAKEESLQSGLVGRNCVIGSRLHLNFAAQPAFLRRFLQPAALASHAVER